MSTPKRRFNLLSLTFIVLCGKKKPEKNQGFNGIRTHDLRDTGAMLYQLSSPNALPMCGFIAQLVEHRTGIAEVTGSNPIEVLVFFRLLLSNCLNWKINCDDHSSLSSTSAVQIWIISYILHALKFCNKGMNLSLWTECHDKIMKLWIT